MYEYRKIMYDFVDATVKSAVVVSDNFGKEMHELKPKYKGYFGDTVRIKIDTGAQEIMQNTLLPIYPDAVYNLEENDRIKGKKKLGNILSVYGDPFDGTANAQCKLPLSTQGLMASVNGKYVVAVASHPFEGYIIYGAEGVGVFRTELGKNSDGTFFLRKDTERQLPRLDKIYAGLLKGDLILMPYVDAHYNPTNFVAERKAQWKQLFVETLDVMYGGQFNARMMREMGSNIDACMKLAEGRLHVQLTDTVGGVYDVAPGAVFMSLLGGVLTDQFGNPFRVPETKDEMKTPPQQIAIASIHPELHEKILDITSKCYGDHAKIYFPSIEQVIEVGPYTGFKDWNPENKKIHDNIREIQKLRRS